MNNKETAVDWLVEKLKSSGLIKFTEDNRLKGELDLAIIKEQAKEITRKQILEAILNFTSEAQEAVQYFEQTYKNDN